MNFTGWIPFVVAQLDRASRLRALSRGFDGEHATREFPTVILLCLLLATALGIVFMVLRRKDGGDRRIVQADYLARAARVAGLGRGETRDLRRLAKLAQLKEPAAVLLSPRCLSEALEEAMAVEDDRFLRQRVEALGQRLFGAAEAEATPESDAPNDR